MLDRDFHNRKSHGVSWTLWCKGSCITHGPFLHTSHSRHSVWPQTLHSSCPRLFLDLVVQPLLQMSHSVWAYTNNLPFFTFQAYSWTLFCKGSCIRHNPDIPSDPRHCIHHIPLKLPKAIPTLPCAAALACVTFCLSLRKQLSILHVPALFLDSAVQRVLHKSCSVWVLNNTPHSVYIPKDVFLMSEPEAENWQELGMLLRREGEVTQSNMADGSGNGASRLRSMSSSLLTTHMNAFRSKGLQSIQCNNAAIT